MQRMERLRRGCAAGKRPAFAAGGVSGSVYGPAGPGRADLRLCGKQKGKPLGYDDP